MKRIAPLSLAVVFGVIIGIILTGCTSTRIEQISGADFVVQAKRMEQISSFHSTIYIGSSNQRAYLEFRRPSLLYNIIGKRTRTTVYWTELSELPEDIADQVKAGNPPWKHQHSETNETERAIEFTAPKNRPLISRKGGFQVYETNLSFNRWDVIRLIDFGLLTRIHDRDQQSNFGLCVTQICELQVHISSIPESGKGRGESAFFILPIEIWEAKKEPPPDTHQGTTLISQINFRGF